MMVTFKNQISKSRISGAVFDDAPKIPTLARTRTAQLTLTPKGLTLKKAKSKRRTKRTPAKKNWGRDDGGADVEVDGDAIETLTPRDIMRALWTVLKDRQTSSIHKNRLKKIH